MAAEDSSEGLVKAAMWKKVYKCLRRMISNVLSHNSVQGKYNGILEKTHDLQCAESQQCASV